MASAINKKTCAKCDKGGGTAMCYGCEQDFCTKHFIEHRQELSQQMDNIGQEHDVLRRDLTHEQGMHPRLARINQWEQESIIKIQTAAKSARADLQQLLNKTNNNLKTSVNKMTEDLQTSRESDDYTESDIKKWTDQLKELHQMLDSATIIKIDYDNDAQSFVHLIEVSEQHSYVDERFVDTYGEIKLSKDGLTATCLGNYIDRTHAIGRGQYSSGTHYIRFRVERNNTGYYTFLGIINSSEKMVQDIPCSNSCHGWWDLDYFVVNGKESGNESKRMIETGDEITLLLDCTERRIQLKHHRTNRTVGLPIDLRLCAFPWKIVVILIAKNDCMEILH